MSLGLLEFEEIAIFAQKDIWSVRTANLEIVHVDQNDSMENLFNLLKLLWKDLNGITAVTSNMAVKI